MLFYRPIPVTPYAEVVELVDTHDSGSCGSDPVEVQILSSALHAGFRLSFGGKMSAICLGRAG